MKTFIAVRFTDSGVAYIGKIVYHQFFFIKQSRLLGSSDNGSHAAL